MTPAEQTRRLFEAHAEADEIASQTPRKSWGDVFTEATLASLDGQIVERDAIVLRREDVERLAWERANGLAIAILAALAEELAP